MMRPPNEFELQHMVLGGAIGAYDPVKAHEYYERTKKLKGRKRGQVQTSNGRVPSRGRDPRTGKRMDRIQKEARAKQRKELSTRIQSLSNKLNKLEAKIRELEHEEASEDRKGTAKKERAAKEADKPKSAAEKAEAARESKKDRAKNQQQEKSKETSADSGSSSDKKSGSKTGRVSELKTLATKVKGQIAVAKQKLAAL
jgi:hypothetical protein